MAPTVLMLVSLILMIDWSKKKFHQYLSIDPKNLVNTYRLIQKKFATPTLTHAHFNVHKPSTQK